MSITRFIETRPSLESYWRAIVLFGRNVASYKFALARALLETGKNTVSLEELSRPFAARICEHLRQEDRQGTSRSSKFLDACRAFNAGRLDEATLHATTEKLGFVNVLDAFHIVNEAQIEPAFFKKFRQNGKTYLSLTDELFKLKEQASTNELMHEVEARWNLVETAWSFSMSASVIRIDYDENSSGLYTLQNTRRKNVTSARDALNGYQKGRCFYCMRDIALDGCDVDHFFPHALKMVSALHGDSLLTQYDEAASFRRPPDDDSPHLNVDGIWNLVLACPECNRGAHGKFAKVPELPYLERLNTRNEFFISSHHPLRETLMLQTGATPEARRSFLQRADTFAIDHLLQRWRPVDEQEGCF